MTPINAVESNNNLTTVAPAPRSRALNGDDFMKLMITGLTNQDPLDPMTNQDLLNQMSTIQQMQSNQEMSNSFNTLIKNFDSLLMRQAMSTATRMIGQLVSGTTDTGQFAVGRVVAVSIDNGNVMLDIDTGQRINWSDIERFGGNSSQDIIGDIAVGKSLDGSNVVGKIVSVEIGEDGVILHLEVSGSQDGTIAIPLTDASILNDDTADMLIGYHVENADEITGIVESVEWNSTGVMLNIIDSENEKHQISLESLTKIHDLI